MCGTPPLFRPIRHLAEEGAGGRALIKEGGCYVIAYAARGRAAYEVRLALDFLH